MVRDSWVLGHSSAMALAHDELETAASCHQWIQMILHFLCQFLPIRRSSECFSAFFQREMGWFKVEKYIANANGAKGIQSLSAALYSHVQQFEVNGVTGVATWITKWGFGKPEMTGSKQKWERKRWRNKKTILVLCRHVSMRWFTTCLSSREDSLGERDRWPGTTI